MEIQGLLGKRTAECACGAEHEIAVRAVEIADGATERIAPYLEKRGVRRPLIVADSRTWEAAGRVVRAALESAGIAADACVIPDNERGEVAADERAIVRTLLAMAPDADALIAVGSGTLHDVARIVSHRAARPFLSVPTAASVDGFTSPGAPLVLDGFKQTVPAHPPEAMFADPGLLARAPQELTAAGFGDMLGKYTSLADWRLGHALLGEAVCPTAEEWTRQGLRACVEQAEGLGRHRPEAVRALMEGLTLSGFAMLAAGHSRPASGAEHHLSHFWEMTFIREGRRAVLHGAKVGAACLMMARLYNRVAAMGAEEAQARLASRPAEDAAAMKAAVARAYPGIAGSVAREFFSGAVPEADDPQAFRRTVVERWAAIAAVAAGVPKAAELERLLRSVGGPTTPEELGVSPALVSESLAAAPFVRNRFTILRLARMLGLTEEARG